MQTRTLEHKATLKNMTSGKSLTFKLSLNHETREYEVHITAKKKIVYSNSFESVIQARQTFALMLETSMYK